MTDFLEENFSINLKLIILIRKKNPAEKFMEVKGEKLAVPE